MIFKGLQHLYRVIASNAAVILDERKRDRDERALQRILHKMAVLFFSVSPVIPLETMEALMPAMMRQLRKDLGKTTEDPFFVAVWVKSLHGMLVRAPRDDVRTIVLNLIAKVQDTQPRAA